MSKRETGKATERIVGMRRNATEHLARAVSAEQRVYVLHSEQCKSTTPDLRDCPYSIALDEGIDLEAWHEFQDQPVRVTIDPEYDDLVPHSVPESHDSEVAT